MAAFYRWQDSALLLYCHIQPNARDEKFVGQHGERLKIRIRAAATDGQANASLIAFIAKAFAVRKNQVKIVSGEQSRQKTLNIDSPTTLPPDLDITEAGK
ncbi:MAG: DUF167 family protein [Spongiibacteraceae bacterium]